MSNEFFNINIVFTKEEKSLIEKLAKKTELTVKDFVRLNILMPDKISFTSMDERNKALVATMEMLQSNLRFISEHGDKLNPEI
ncbi:MAG: hypothetical protein ACI4QE_02755, partial [Acutalibacteraceae bacterium]